MWLFKKKKAPAEEESGRPGSKESIISRTSSLSGMERNDDADDDDLRMNIILYRGCDLYTCADSAAGGLNGVQGQGILRVWMKDGSFRYVCHWCDGVRLRECVGDHILRHAVSSHACWHARCAIPLWSICCRNGCGQMHDLRDSPPSSSQLFSASYITMLKIPRAR